MDLQKSDGLEHVYCNLCQSTQAAVVLSMEWREDQRLQFIRCSNCGLVYLDPRPTLELMGQLCDEPYYTHSANENLYDKFKNALLRTLARLHFGYTHLGANNKLDAFLYWISKPFKEKWLKVPYYVQDGHLLDVGCGNGDYLAFLSQLGWECQGTELSEKAAACARSRGLEVSVGNLLDLQLPSASYDVVTLWHVIEHLHDPTKALIQTNRLLKTEGIAILGTPNIASGMYKIFGRNWHALHLPYHLYLFSPETLTKVLQTAGFEVMFVKFYSSPRGLGLDIRRCISNILPISIDTLYRCTSRFDLALLPITMGLDLLTHGNNMIVWARKVRNIDDYPSAEKRRDAS